MQPTSPFQNSLSNALAALAAPKGALRTEASRASLLRIARRAQGELLERVLPFWEARVIDPAHCGLFHYFDRAGERTETLKCTWGQGRMAYTFSLLCLELGDEHAGYEKWRQAADSARTFVVEHAYAGGGRWHYLCDREGNVLDASGSAYSDAFCLMGLCAYALATGQERDLSLIDEGLDVLTTNLQNPDFSEFHHFQLDSAYRWHGPAMVACGLAPLARAVLGPAAVAPLADWAMDEILWNFANDEQRMLLEMTDRQGRLVETDQGRTTNPGHTMESMWFALEEALVRDDRRSIERCLRIIRWAFEKGWDREHGGLFAFIGVDGERPPGDDVVLWGDRWDDKLWWVQAESMYTLALAAAISDDPFYFDNLDKLQAWAFDHLPDDDYGGWFLSTTRDGRPKKTIKGNVFRSAFHVPRSLLKVWRLGEAADGVELAAR